MQLVYDGKAKLTADQVSMIFRDCIETRMVALHRIYEPDWKKFRVNEQLTILSRIYTQRDNESNIVKK